MRLRLLAFAAALTAANGLGDAARADPDATPEPVSLAPTESIPGAPMPLALSVAADGTAQLAAIGPSGPGQLLTAAPGAAFGAPTGISGSSGLGDVQLAADGSGVELTETAMAVRARLLSADGRRAAKQVLSRHPLTPHAELAIAPDGTAVVGWVERSGRRLRARVAVRMPQSPRFGAAQTVGAGYDYTEILVAAGPHGDGLIGENPVGTRLVRDGRLQPGLSHQTGAIAMGADGTGLIVGETDGPHAKAAAALIPATAGRIPRLRVIPDPTAEVDTGAELPAVAPDGQAAVLQEDAHGFAIHDGPGLSQTTYVPFGGDAYGDPALVAGPGGALAIIDDGEDAGVSLRVGVRPPGASGFTVLDALPPQPDAGPTPLAGPAAFTPDGTLLLLASLERFSGKQVSTFALRIRS